MAARMGRPPKQETSRNKSLNIRLTEQELRRIEDCAERLNLSRTDVIMRGIELVESQKK